MKNEDEAKTLRVREDMTPAERLFQRGNIMTNQEMFDKTWSHLVKQGRPSRIGDVCQYHSPDGAQCAAGIFIPDEKYTPDMEGAYIDFVISNWMPELRPFEELLVDLQAAHDTCRCIGGRFDLQALREEFIIIGTSHGLSLRELAHG